MGAAWGVTQVSCVIMREPSSHPSHLREMEVGSGKQ